MSLTKDLPPALPSMWRALKRGYEAEPLLLSVSFGLSLLAALPDALLALWFKVLADGVLGGRRGLVAAAAVGLGVSATATWFLRVISDRTQRRFRDQVGIALESHVARLQASVATIEHHERPEVPRSARHAAQPDLRARPHVHVGLLHLRLDPAPRGHPRAAGLHPSGAGVARCVRPADGAYLHLAAGRGARRRRAGRVGQSPGAASVRPGNDRSARQRGARHPDRRTASCRSAAKRGSAGTDP